MKIRWKHQILTIQQCEHSCIDDLFMSLFISKKTKYQYYQEGNIRINNQVHRQNHILTPMDTIEITSILELTPQTCTPCFEELDILYEDELFLIINKISGRIVHSDGVTQETTLYDVVKGYYITQGIQVPVRAIHRLDKDTTGAVIFCKIPLLQPLLDHMLMQKDIQRHYIALCSGHIKNTSFTIDACIGRDRHSSKMRVSSNGKSALTNVHVVKRYQDYTYIECRLQQGRTHQIRVHLAFIGHPLLSDPQYGTPDSRIHRCALHASRVVLYHPLLQKSITVDCPVPNDIKRQLK